MSQNFARFAGQFEIQNHIILDSFKFSVHLIVPLRTERFTSLDILFLTMVSVWASPAAHNDDRPGYVASPEHLGDEHNGRSQLTMCTIMASHLPPLALN